jgi:hypothetical protein
LSAIAGYAKVKLSFPAVVDYVGLSSSSSEGRGRTELESEVCGVLLDPSIRKRIAAGSMKRK